MNKNPLGDEGVLARWTLIPAGLYFALSILGFKLHLDWLFPALSWPAFWAMHIFISVLFGGHMGAGFGAEGLLILFCVGFYLTVGAISSLFPTPARRAGVFVGVLTGFSLLGIGLERHDRKVQRVQFEMQAKEKARLEAIPAERAKLAEVQIKGAQYFVKQCLQFLTYNREHGNVVEYHGLPGACGSNGSIEYSAKEALRLSSPSPADPVWCSANLYLSFNSVLKGNASVASGHFEKWSHCSSPDDEDRQLVAIYHQYLPASEKEEKFDADRWRTHR